MTVVGEHATGHQKYDAPLQSDIAAVAGSVSAWLRTSAAAADVGRDAAEAVAAAGAGRVATLVLPADVSWSEGGVPADPAGGPRSSGDRPRRVAGRRRGAALGRARPAAGGRRRLPRGRAGRGKPDRGRHRSADARRDVPGSARARRGVAPVGRLAYLVEQAQRQLGGHPPPHPARGPRAGGVLRLPRQAGRSRPRRRRGARGGAPSTARGGRGRRRWPISSRRDTPPTLAAAPRPELPTGPLTVATAAAVIGALLPEGAVVVDESNTAGVGLPTATAGAPRHDWLTLTGGAIGYGLPAATGAALACPDRPVWCLRPTAARCTRSRRCGATPGRASTSRPSSTTTAPTRSCALELRQVGAAGHVVGDGARARSLLDLGDPRLDFVALASGMGVPATSVDTAEGLADALRGPRPRRGRIWSRRSCRLRRMRRAARRAPRAARRARTWPFRATRPRGRRSSLPGNGCAARLGSPTRRREECA